jgi:hypothetical protein
MTDDLAKQHAELIRQRQAKAAKSAEYTAIRNKTLDAKIPAVFREIEQAAQTWVNGINAEFKGDQTNQAEYWPGDAITVPRPGFRIRRSYFTSVAVTVALDLEARSITATTHQTRAHGDPGIHSEMIFALELDGKDNVIITALNYSSQPPVNVLSIDDIINALVVPIVEAMSK